MLWCIRQGCGELTGGGLAHSGVCIEAQHERARELLNIDAPPTLTRETLDAARKKMRAAHTAPSWLDGFCDHLAREMDKSKAP